MEDISWRWRPQLLLITVVMGLCYGFPIKLDSNHTDNHAQFLTSLLAVLLATCSVFVLVGCLCCQRRKGFKEFHDSTIAVTDIHETGHVNPVSASEFTIFKPLTNLTLTDSIFQPDEKANLSLWFSEPPFSRSRLQYVKELGKGWFGRVVEGTITDNPDSVAVRILESSATSKERAAFLQDALIYRLSDHPNVLKFIGCSLEIAPLLIVQEYNALGDLKRFLREKNGLLSTDWLLNCCVQITGALKYVHDLKLVHSDLAARSCLVCNDFIVKLGDYGLQAVLYPDDYYQGVLGVPLRWCAPESVVYTATIIETKPVTYESNVWSLGVTLWEICESGKQPYEGLTDDEVLVQVVGEKRVRLEKPQLMKTLYTDYLYEIITQCWADVDIRPTIARIDAMLIDLLRVFHNNSFETCWTEAKAQKEEDNQLAFGDEGHTGCESADWLWNKKSDMELPNEEDDDAAKQEGIDVDETVKELCDTKRQCFEQEFESGGALSDSKFDQRWNEAKTNNKLLLSDSLTNLAAFELDTDPLWTDTLLREKSRSVTDLMVLTHIECSESDSETPFQSLEWKKRCFGSDGDVAECDGTSSFRESLSKMQNKSKNINATNVPETYRVPKLSEIIENNVELVDYIIAKHETVFESMKVFDEEDLSTQSCVTNNNFDVKPCDSIQCKYKWNQVLEETEKFLELEKLYYDCSDAVLPQSGVILGPCDSYALDFYTGLKTTSENYEKVPEFQRETLENAESRLVMSEPKPKQDYIDTKLISDCSDIPLLKDSGLSVGRDLNGEKQLHTDENFQKEMLDSIESNLIKELEQEKAIADISGAENEEDELDKTFTFECEEDNSTNDPLNTTFTVTSTQELNTTFTVDDHKPQAEEKEGQTKNWSESGWYLHLQTDSPLPDGNLCSPSSSSLMNEEEIMTAIRNELLSKLPNASGGNNSQSFSEEEDLLLDWATEDSRERDEMLVRYRTYLSPIPEENELSESGDAKQEVTKDVEINEDADLVNDTSSSSSDESNCDIDSNSEDSDSDWSLKDSNDTLFNVQDLKCEQKPSVSNIPPLPSPEDIPWRQLPASLLSYDQLTVADGTPDAEITESAGFLSDLRFLGPTASANVLQIGNCCEMSTSFSESVEGNDEEEEEDNGEDWESDTRSSSSGEFIWKEGEHEESVRVLPPSGSLEENEFDKDESKRRKNAHAEGKMDLDDLEEEEEDDSDGSSLEEGDLHEFVPSAWDMNATPTKSSLRSPSRQNTSQNSENPETNKKTGQVWFKKQKYHCVYEYPREPEEEESPHSNKPHYFGHSTLNDLTNTDWTLFNQQIALVSSMGRDEDFFISSSATPFQNQQHSANFEEPSGYLPGTRSSAEFFPGHQQYNQHLQLWTPDSGVDSEDAQYGYITPSSEHSGGSNCESAAVQSETNQSEGRAKKTGVESLKTLASVVLAARDASATKAGSTADNGKRKESLGQLRHTRDKLKLDLLSTAVKLDRSSSSSSSSSSMDSKLDSYPTYLDSDTQQHDSNVILNRLGHDSKLGTSPCLGDGNSPVLSRRSPPTFSTFGKQSSRFQVSHVWTPPEEEVPLGGSKLKDVSFQALPHVRGEASLLDSADEDSGIESSTLERLRLL